MPKNTRLSIALFFFLFNEEHYGVEEKLFEFSFAKCINNLISQRIHVGAHFSSRGRGRGRISAGREEHSKAPFIENTVEEEEDEGAAY